MNQSALPKHSVSMDEPENLSHILKKKYYKEKFIDIWC